MSLSSRYSTSPIDDSIYEPVTGSHHPRRNGDTGGHIVPEYRVHALVPLTAQRHPQSHLYPYRRSSDSIVNVQSPASFNDEWHLNPPADWVYDLSAHAYQPLGSYPIKQSEYTVDMQGSFTDHSSINNTRLYDLEEHHIDAHLGVPPPDYSESDGGWSLPLYDTDPYYERQPASHCLLYPHLEPAICDNPYSTSNSLQEVHGYSKDQGSSQPNHAHVPPGMHIDISTADSHGQHVGTSISLNLTMDHDCMMLDPCETQNGCAGPPQLLHTERPPISSYSEFSAQMSYYNGLNSSSSSSRQSKTLGSAATSVSLSASASAPASASTATGKGTGKGKGTGTGTGPGTPTVTSAVAQDSSSSPSSSRPLKRRDTGAAPADWKQTPRSTAASDPSSKETRPSQKRSTPPPPPPPQPSGKTAPALPFEAWTPPTQSQQPQSQSQSQSQSQPQSQSQSQSQSQRKGAAGGDRVLVKHEERPSPPLSSSSRRKHHHHHHHQHQEHHQEQQQQQQQQQHQSSSSSSSSSSSPTSSRRSCSNESRRSRTLSPSSRSQGILKTIMMKRGGSEQKKQNLACLFCRERKIACGRPAEGSLDPTCNQCLRRSLVCQYPTESRRGQHKRNAKKNADNNGHDVHRAK